MFTVDWFSHHAPLWKSAFGHLEGLPNLRALEIGTFEGRSAVWMLGHVLTHDTSRIVCVDTFEGSDEHGPEQMADMFDTFCENIQSQKHKVRICKGRSADVLKTTELVNSKFDIVYIDGDHHSRAVLEDAVLAFPLLKSGGIMVFDDYAWNDVLSLDSCHIGIECFLRCYADKLRVVHMGMQVFIQKL